MEQMLDYAMCLIIYNCDVESAAFQSIYIFNTPINIQCAIHIIKHTCIVKWTTMNFHR